MLYTRHGIITLYKMAICLAWKIDDKRMDNFIGGPKFHLPFRCDQLRVEGDTVCAKCLGKRAKPRKKEGTYPQKWWGILSEPIDNIGPQINKMAYSPWFLEKAKQYSLSQESMARVKKMYAAATAAVEPLPPVPEITAISADTIAVTVEKPKKAVRKKKEVSVVASVAPVAVAAPVAPVTQVKEKKKPVPKKPTKKAEAATTAVAVESTPLPTISGIVENAEPVASDDTVFIKVRNFDHNNKSYLYNSAKHKLYDKKTYQYVGRWDPEREHIHSDIPDSDIEE
jgi:hypothetical protein